MKLKADFHTNSNRSKDIDLDARAEYRMCAK